MSKFIPLILLSALIFTGCVQQIAVRTVGGLLDEGFTTFFEESDLELAETAIGANLKLLEALLKNDPENKPMLVLVAQGYSAYALAFIEDKDPVRARNFYLRGRDYALRALAEEKELLTALDADIPTLERTLRNIPRSKIPGLFWLGFSWGSAINISRDDPAALADLPKAVAIMEQVQRMDSTYFHAGADMFLGAIAGTVPVMIGGKPERSKMHFERALAITKRSFLLTHVYYAQSYAIQVQDRALYESLLNEVLEMPLERAPDVRLPNAVAQRKAALMLQNIDDLF